MHNVALKLLREAAARGWTFEVPDPDGGRVPDYNGAGPVATWNAVREVEEANVIFYDAAGVKLGVAYLMAPGAGSCAPDESLVDYSCRDGSPFTALCDALIAEVI